MDDEHKVSKKNKSAHLEQNSQIFKNKFLKAGGEEPVQLVRSFKGAPSLKCEGVTWGEHKVFKKLG